MGYAHYFSFFSEAIPFLVVTIGFERPFKLTKRVLEYSKETPLTRQDVRETISRAIDSVALSIARDCVIEIMVLTLGAKSTITGLREFCFLSAILLAYDVLFLFTWYTSVLALKLEVGFYLFIYIIFFFALFTKNKNKTHTHIHTYVYIFFLLVDTYSRT